MKTSHVLYIVPSANIGGAETFIQHCAKFHRRYIPVFALLRDGVLASWLQNQSVETHIAPNPPRLRNPLSQLQGLLWLKRLVIRSEIKLIHSNMAYAALLGGPLAKLTGLPHIWFQHGPASGFMDSLAGSLPHQRLLVNSAYTEKTQLLLEKNIPEILRPRRQISLFPLGVDFDAIAQLETTMDLPKEREKFRTGLCADFKLPKDTPVAGMVCRLQEWKGVHTFIRAIQLANKFRPFCGVVWGGSQSANESDSYKTKLIAMIAAEKIPVLLAGPTAEPLKALSFIDYIVNASLQPEPFGLSIIEGMCMGAWPIVPNEGGPLETVQRSQIGSLFVPGSAEDLSRKLLDADELTSKMSKEHVQKKSRALFEAKKSIEYLETIYDQETNSR